MRDAPLQLETVPGSAPETIIVRLNGPLTLTNLFGLQDQLRSLQVKHTILDFENVPYMDSAGLGAVVNFYVSSERRGQTLALAGVNGRVLALFEQTKVNQVLSFYTGTDEAEAAIWRSQR
jgi:anti-sigma B factor antagonist